MKKNVILFIEVRINLRIQYLPSREFATHIAFVFSPTHKILSFLFFSFSTHTHTYFMATLEVFVFFQRGKVWGLGSKTYALC